MKRILIASVACVALSLPAMAAQNSPNASQPNMQQQQTQPGSSKGQTMGKQAQEQNGSQMQASNGAQQMIQPSSLSKKEVRQIQMKLDKAGFNTKKVDGIWGRETADAMRDFQKSKNLPGNGELNQQTLAALGVNISNQSQAQNTNENKQQQNASSGQSQSSKTVGQSPSHSPNNSSRNSTPQKQ
ncbi:MAG: peptidoglycan-binding domain-containing protein [Bradyrhizobium sp.]